MELKIAAAKKEASAPQWVKDIDAPFPKLQKGQKLCSYAIPPGDPFYEMCMACENVPLSRFDACRKKADPQDLVSARMQRSPYFKEFKKGPRTGGG
jgi:hypothetical protein